MEELKNIQEKLQSRGGSMSLIDEKGNPMFIDDETNLFITGLQMKENTVYALIPLGHFSDETIEFLDKLTSAEQKVF